MTTNLPVEVAIGEHFQAYGLAIIISNDYCDAAMLDTLTGTHKDGQRMKATFESIGFATVHKQNLTLNHLQELIHEATQTVRYPESYKSICFVFSGHGGCDTNEKGDIELRYLYDQIGKKMEIANIVTPFMPKAAPKIGNIPKVFFIDACRGEKEMHEEAVMVPKSGGAQSRDGVVHHKGGNEKVQLEVPPESNYLIAYATTENYKSYEVKHGGGIWLRALSDMIREKAATESISSILEEVHAVLKHKYQDPRYKIAMTRPEFNSKLDGSLYLVPKVCSGITPSKFSQGQISQPTSGGPLEALSRAQSDGRYQTMLNEYAQNNCMYLPSYETVQYYHNEHKQQYFKTGVTVHLRNGMIIKEDSRQYYITQQLSQEEAAKNACEVIGQRQMQYQQLPPQYNGAQSMYQQWPQAYNNPVNVTTQVYTQPQAGPHPLMQGNPVNVTTQVYTQPQAGPHPLIQGQQSLSGQCFNATSPLPLSIGLQPVRGKGLPPSGSYREQLNHFFQTNKVNPQYDYVSDNSGGQPRYRCTIKYFMNGKTERVDSGGYYCSKGEAKESAAKKILIKERK